MRRWEMNWSTKCKGKDWKEAWWSGKPEGTIVSCIEPGWKLKGCCKERVIREFCEGGGEENGFLTWAYPFSMLMWLTLYGM